MYDIYRYIVAYTIPVVDMTIFFRYFSNRLSFFLSFLRLGWTFCSPVSVSSFWSMILSWIHQQPGLAFTFNGHNGATTMYQPKTIHDTYMNVSSNWAPGDLVVYEFDLPVALDGCCIIFKFKAHRLGHMGYPKKRLIGTINGKLDGTAFHKTLLEVWSSTILTLVCRYWLCACNERRKNPVWGIMHLLEGVSLVRTNQSDNKKVASQPQPLWGGQFWVRKPFSLSTRNLLKCHLKPQHGCLQGILLTIFGAWFFKSDDVRTPCFRASQTQPPGTWSERKRCQSGQEKTSCWGWHLKQRGHESSWSSLSVSIVHIIVISFFSYTINIVYIQYTYIHYTS